MRGTGANLDLEYHFLTIFNWQHLKINEWPRFNPGTNQLRTLILDALDPASIDPNEISHILNPTNIDPLSPFANAPSNVVDLVSGYSILTSYFAI